MTGIEYISGTRDQLPIRLRLFGRNLGECCWLRRMADLDGVYGIYRNGTSFGAKPDVHDYLKSEPWLLKHGKLSKDDLEDLGGELNPPFCDNDPSHPICVND